MALEGVGFKRSSVQGKAPSPTADLDYGDLALNFHQDSGAIYARAADDTLLVWPAGYELPPATEAGEVLTLINPGGGAPLIAEWAPATGGEGGGAGVGDALPEGPGTASAGVSSLASRQDHVHPADELKADLESPVFTGTPEAPTAAPGTSTTQLATCAFVAAATPAATTTVSGLVELATAAETTTGTDAVRAVTPAGLKVELDKKAPLESPAFTGTPSVPTANDASNDTTIASTAFVKSALPAAASDTVAGLIELATSAEVTTGTDALRAVTPATLKVELDKKIGAADLPVATFSASGIVELATAAETTTGTDATRAVTPAGLKVELDKKANLASPTFTGAPAAPTAAPGTNTTQIASTAFVQAALPAAASEVASGLVELATSAEAITGTDALRAVTPAALKSTIDNRLAALPAASETVSGIVELATAAEVTAGLDGLRAVTPAGLKVELDKKANLASPAFTGTPTVPTAAPGTNTTQAASTAFVQAAVVAGVSGVATLTAGAGLTDSGTATEPVINVVGATGGGITVNADNIQINRTTVDAWYTAAAHAGATGSAHGVATTLAHGFMSSTDKTKLDGIGTGATLVSLTAGDGLSNGGTATAPVLHVGAVAGGGITVNVNDIQVNRTTVDTWYAAASHVGASGAAHANATTSVAGFMSSADKTKLDGITSGASIVSLSAGAGLTNSGTATVPVINVVGAANGGITVNADDIQINRTTVDAWYTAAAHAGATGSAHGAATTLVAGFMSSADKTKLDGITSGASIVSLSAGAGLTNSGTATAPVINVVGAANGGITVNADDIQINRTTVDAWYTAAAHAGATGSAHGAATTLVAGFMSAADKTKIDLLLGTSSFKLESLSALP